MNGDHLSDALMLLAVIVTMGAALHFARRKRDYLVAAWVGPLLWLAAYYAILLFEVDPVHDNPELRMFVYRPGMLLMLLFVTLHLLNGKINLLIDRVHARMKRWWNQQFFRPF